jgi:ATP-dependent DNA helicase DinG
MTVVTARNIMDSFPTNDFIKGPRKGQTDVLNAIEKAFADGYKNVLLEAPVGSGKSAIAVACAKYYGTAHILTPRKSLQDQYLDDFRKAGVTLMKGRNAYPCTWPSEKHRTHYKHIISLIESGGLIQPAFGQRTCDKGECKNNAEAYMACTGDEWDPFTRELVPGPYPCPYKAAIEVAQKSDMVVHNLHSFIFQSYFAGRFDPRSLMVIDECHEVQGIVRGFAEVKFTLPFLLKDEEIPSREECKTMDDWGSWAEQFATKLSERPRMDGSTERSDFLDTIEKMTMFSDQFEDKFVMKYEEGPDGRSTRFIFIPEKIGNLVNTYLLEYGDKRLLMSGTIYNKNVFCSNNGLKPEETCFMRIGSSFPVDTRPIYFKPDYRVDTSHKAWDENFSEMIEKVKAVLDVFDDCKGLIHTPSYKASLIIYNALKDTDRMVIHDKDNFHEMLSKFYSSESSNKVFLSPICQQGVDFKYDRARFQIVIRVPYPNTSDPFVEHKVKNDFQWYNYEALVAFGQQVGRVNRSDDDFGATILLDERFGKFISKNKSVLPKWLTDAIIYK